MSIKGSSYQRFRRALTTGNPLLIRTAAAELPPLSLADALRVTLAYRGRDLVRYQRASGRWLGRLALSAPLSIAELQIVAGALEALREGQTQPGAEALGAVFAAHSLIELEQVLSEQLED